MSQLKFIILAQDIREANYHSSDCPITRALKRAGYNAYDGGIKITMNEGSEEEVSISTPEYRSMVERLLGMYRSKEHPRMAYESPAPVTPIEDFEVTLDY